MLTRRSVEDVVISEITTDHADDADVRKEAGGNGKVRGRATKHLLALAERSFNYVVGYGTNN